MSEIHRTVIPSDTPWKQRIADLKVLLEDIRPQLVAAEQRLSEQLASISSFEFRFRSRLELLSRRLDKLLAEIAVLEKELRRLRESYMFLDAFDEDELFQTWRSSEAVGSAAAGDFRYHEPPSMPAQPQVSPDLGEKLKRLYRRLARRFHPDFALDEADREYRTGVMMAINAAYAAGDIKRLEALLEQPDPQQPEYSDEELADALLREVHHCQRRIGEIDEELARLRRHPSYILMRRADQAERAGRDLLEELAADLREKIAGRMVQRDVLLAEIESFENGEPEFVDDALADTVYALGLEDVLVEDADSGVSEWRDRNRDRIDFAETDIESEWDALRQARDRGRRRK